MRPAGLFPSKQLARFDDNYCKPAERKKESPMALLVGQFLVTQFSTLEQVTF